MLAVNAFEFAAHEARRAESRSSRSSASASAESLSGSTRNPRSLVMSSGLPPTFVATTGTPAAIDSRIEFDRLSDCEGRTETSSDARTAGISRRSPRKIARSPNPRLCASCSSCERRGPSPARTNSKFGYFACNRAAARRKMLWFFARVVHAGNHANAQYARSSWQAPALQPQKVRAPIHFQ